MRLFSPLIFLALALVGLPNDVRAQAQFDLSPMLSHYRHRETTDDGRTLNRERGMLYGVALSTRYPLGPQWYGRAHGQWMGGRIDYTGVTQANRPLSTHTEYDDRRLGLALEHCLGQCRTRLSAGVEHTRRERDIRPTSDSLRLFETFTGWDWHLGASQRLLAPLTVNARAVYSRSATVRPDLSVIGYGTPTVPLPSSWGADLGLDWSLISRNGLDGKVFIQYEWRESPSSDAVQVSNARGQQISVNQPNTRVEQWQLGLSLTWRR
ncbi:hypothetical protein [Marinimicrobium alkaliphilum]|uniref:hypothetical protein n=1 Tax=Marinimicrobium alkaliphilum TaxID=2202654 RepID=UPI000DB922E7|nr:hypothetical protein [Marinimicrobium alkaliphilum]